MDHQNIVKLYEVYEDSDHFYLIMDLLKGGELFDDIVKRQKFNEADARHVMLQVLSAINYLHKKGFVHRDIKPENICLDGDQVKIIDFGTARKFTKGKKLKQVIGTPFYMAPEIFNEKKYNEKADIWSTGIVMYILLTGKAPYFGNDDDKIIAQAKKGMYNRQLLTESNISKQAQTLIEKLLAKDYKIRDSAESAIQNPWIQKKKQLDKLDNQIQQQIMNNLRGFNAHMKLQQAVLTLMIHQLVSAEEMEDNKRMFAKLDTNQDGCLERAEISAGMKEIYGHIDEEEIDEIMNLADMDGNGRLEFSEWLVATIKHEHILDEVKLKQAFQYFNKKQNGKISLEELKSAMGNNGLAEGLEEQVYIDILSEVDENGDGFIDFEEFKNMMAKLVSDSNRKMNKM